MKPQRLFQVSTRRSRETNMEADDRQKSTQESVDNVRECFIRDPAIPDLAIRIFITPLTHHTPNQLAIQEIRHPDARYFNTHDLRRASRPKNLAFFPRNTPK